MKTWMLCGAAVCLVALGFARMPPTSSLYGDALRYVAMVDEGPASTIAPFRYRIVVPLVAKLLPFPAAAGLLLISVAGLLTFYMLTMASSMRLGASAPAAVVALVAVFFTFWHQYTFHNPYLTDAVQIAMLAAMLHAIVVDRFLLFACAAILAVGTRESSFALVPAWFLLKDRKRGAAVVFAAVAALAGIRIWLGDGTPFDESLGRAYRAAGGSDRFPWVFAQRIYDAYGPFWVAIALAIGVNLRRPVLAVSFALLFAGALLASTIAVDTGRMFQLVSPVVVPAIALTLERARARLSHANR